jgi:hypothetical protein
VIGVVMSVISEGGATVGVSVTVGTVDGMSAVEVGVRGCDVEVRVGATVLVGGTNVAVGAVVGDAGAVVALGGIAVTVGFKVKSVKVAVTKGVVVATAVSLAETVLLIAWVATRVGELPTVITPSDDAEGKARKINPIEVANKTMPPTINATPVNIPRIRCCCVIPTHPLFSLDFSSLLLVKRPGLSR